jgi:hypothetical protein
MNRILHIYDYTYDAQGKLGVGLEAGDSISLQKRRFFQMPKRDFNTNISVYYQRGHK